MRPESSCRPPSNSPTNRRWLRRPRKRRFHKLSSAEKSAAEALTAARLATEKALAEKTAHDPALAAATAAVKAAVTPDALTVAAAELTKQVQKSVELTQAIAAAGTSGSRPYHKRWLGQRSSRTPPLERPQPLVRPRKPRPWPSMRPATHSTTPIQTEPQAKKHWSPPAPPFRPGRSPSPQ